ncbi:F-box/kelch-repeat protein [Trifolium medium]|uniref:F-box/kelch-repeat protein n=1 Tax=Trifolium medium TaxID=97028 RepID=A0A392MED1_9FABA|nr:F-box/kelch-repeat protein [Trifolium medium]
MVSDKTKRRRLIGTLTSSSPSLPTLPFDLIPEILCRLPVKFLLQFRCICKLWKSLISDSKFTNKHLTLSTTRTLHCISYSHNVNVLLNSYSLDSTFTSITQTQFPSPDTNVSFVGSCNGILCLVIHGVDLVLLKLWNPSIRKFKELHLPPISDPQKFPFMYGFRYDPISDNYKVVVVFCDDVSSESEVKVHTLGTDSWKSVPEFPFLTVSVSAQPSGQYVSGTINWSVYTGIKRFIVSFDLVNECYQEVLLPGDFDKVDEHKLRLTVFRDCLCMIYGEDVWVMKEYGNKESWTKLFNISYMRHPRAPSYGDIKAICVFEDEQVLLYREDERWRHISYNYKNDTSKFIAFENESNLGVCVESLISPCF